MTLSGPTLWRTLLPENGLASSNCLTSSQSQCVQPSELLEMNFHSRMAGSLLVRLSGEILEAILTLEYSLEPPMALSDSHWPRNPHLPHKTQLQVWDSSSSGTAWTLPIWWPCTLSMVRTLGTSSRTTSRPISDPEAWICFLSR